MRILFILDSVENPTSANVLMAQRLAGVLCAAGHTVHLLELWDGLHPQPELPGCTVHCLAFADERLMNAALENGRSGGSPIPVRLARLCCHPTAVAAAFRQLVLHAPRRVLDTRRELEKLDAAFHFEVICAVCAPYRAAFALETAQVQAKKAIWQLDPYASNRDYQAPGGYPREMELLNLNETELGGTKEAVFAVNGRGAYNRLKYESGVHRVQRVPETETQGRIHTSTATVAVMPQAEEVDFALDMKDLRIDTFRSSGAGGQHINKTSSAIRVTHIPTGTVVECQNERSQFQNKDKALEILRSRLLAQKQKEQQDAINAQRQGQVGTGDRSEKIRTYNFPQDRCTDHRIGLTVHNLEKIMDGNLDEVIDALATREQTEKLQKLGG